MWGCPFAKTTSFRAQRLQDRTPMSIAVWDDNLADAGATNRPRNADRPSHIRGKGGLASLSGAAYCRARATGLQVRLEVGVVADLLVDLQPVPLAVGDNHR